jgi:hypothetical protein
MTEEQEPVGWHTEDHLTDRSATTYSKDMAYRWECKGWPVTPLYASPPKREWVGLTDDERYEAVREAAVGSAILNPSRSTSERIAKAIEAKLKEKNT